MILLLSTFPLSRLKVFCPFANRMGSAEIFSILPLRSRI